MIGRWRPDTCDCVLLYSTGGNKESDYIKPENKCRLHRNIPDSQLHTVVVSHNKPFNLTHGEFPTLPQLEQMGLAKAAERQRIRNLP